MHTSIQQQNIKLIKSDNKHFYIFTKDFNFK